MDKILALLDHVKGLLKDYKYDKTDLLVTQVRVQEISDILNSSIQILEGKGYCTMQHQIRFLQ